MIDKKQFENARKELSEHHQEHVLTFWSQLTDTQKERLLTQVRERAPLNPGQPPGGTRLG